MLTRRFPHKVPFTDNAAKAISRLDADGTESLGSS